MSGRIRSSLRSFFRFFSPHPGPQRSAGAEKEVIQGSAGNVIIVKSPNTEYFKEAIFILCDDLFSRRGVSSRQLLNEARRAASDYCSELVPPRALNLWLYLLFYLLGALSVLVVLTLLKLL